MLRVRIGIAALVALSSLHAVADVVQNKERSYAVTYKDGAVERYAVKWTAKLDMTVRDAGGSPVPFQGSVDNPRCSWSIVPTMQRTVFLVTRLGQPFPLPGMSRTFERELQNAGGGYRTSGQVNESCSGSRRAREDEIDNARRSFLQAVEGITNADLEVLANEARANKEVASITIR